QTVANGIFAVALHLEDVPLELRRFVRDRGFLDRPFSHGTRRPFGWLWRWSHILQSATGLGGFRRDRRFVLLLYSTCLSPRFGSKFRSLYLRSRRFRRLR